MVEAERHLDPGQRERLADLLRTVTLVPDASPAQLPRGVLLRTKDAPILASPIAAGATHLITGDRRDFGALFGKRVGGVLVLPPRDYLTPR